MSENDSIAERRPRQHYLYLTPWLVAGHNGRPLWIFRVIQRIVLGWRWYQNENPATYGLFAAYPGDVEPYTIHTKVDDDIDSK